MLTFVTNLRQIIIRRCLSQLPSLSSIQLNTNILDKTYQAKHL